MNAPLVLKLSLAVLIGIGGGYTIGEWTRTPEGENPRENITPGTSASSREGPIGDTRKAHHPLPPRAAGFNVIAELEQCLTQRQALRPMAVQSLLFTLSPEEVIEVCRHLSLNSSDTLERIEYLSLALGEWAATDPGAALDFVQTLPSVSSLQRQVLLRAILHAWVEKDADAALAWLETVNDPTLKKRLHETMLQKLATIDPGRVLHDLREGHLKMNHRFGLISRLMASDPRLTLQSLEQLPLNAGRNRFLAEALQSWAQFDPDAARTYILGLPPGRLRDQSLQQIVYQLAQENPQEALKLVEGEVTSVHRRRQMMAAAVAFWAQKDPEAAFAEVQKLTGVDGIHALTSVLMSWGQTDPEGALKQLQSVESVRMKVEMMGTLLQQWSQDSPEKVLAWLKENPEFSRQSRIIQPTVHSLMLADPKGAIDLINGLPLSEQRSQFLTSMGQSLAGDSLKAAEQLLANLPPGKDRDRFLQGMIEGQAALDPAGASRQIGRMPEGHERSASIQRLANIWSQTDPKAAIAWALQESNPQNMNVALETIVGNWAQNQKADAAQWVKEMPDGGPRDRVVSRFSATISRSAPQEAIGWAGSIGNERMRESALSNVLRQWVRTDAKAASKWIETADLPSEVRERLQKIR